MSKWLRAVKRANLHLVTNAVHSAQPVSSAPSVYFEVPISNFAEDSDEELAAILHKYFGAGVYSSVNSGNHMRVSYSPSNENSVSSFSNAIGVVKNVQSEMSAEDQERFVSVVLRDHLINLQEKGEADEISLREKARKLVERAFQIL